MVWPPWAGFCPPFSLYGYREGHRGPGRAPSWEPDLGLGQEEWERPEVGHRDGYAFGRGKAGLVHSGSQCWLSVNQRGATASPRPTQASASGGSTPRPLALPALTSGHGSGVTSGGGQVSAGWRRDLQAARPEGSGCYFTRPRSRSTGSSASRASGLCGCEPDVRSRHRSYSRPPTQITGSGGDSDCALAHIMSEGLLSLLNLESGTISPYLVGS